MTTALRQGLFCALILACGFFLSHGKADASVSCSLSSVTNNATNSEVVAGYNVFTAGTFTYNFTFNLSCHGNNGTTLNIYFLGNSSSSGTYTPPYLNGPVSSQLNFDLCLPTTTCSGGTNTWNLSTPFTFTCTNPSDCQTKATNVTGSVYAPSSQNIYAGTFSQYTQTVYFYMPPT